MPRYFKNFLIRIRAARRLLGNLRARRKRHDQALRQLTCQVETLYTLAVLDKMHPGLTENIFSLPPLFADHLSGMDPEALERNLLAARPLRRGRTDVLLDIAQASKLLPVAKRAALYQAALDQADSASGRDLAAWHLARLLFMHGLDDAPLLDILEGTDAPGECPDTERQRRELLAMRIALLTMRGDAGAALPLLERHLSIYGRRSLHVFPPAAWLAHAHGIRGSLLSEAAFVYGHILENREGRSFRGWLEGRRIALVGNGPQETGRGRGGEIDAHDLVVRINHAVVSSKYGADYGTKTNVWCKNGVTPHVYSDFPEARYLLLPNSCERYPAGGAQNRALARTIRKQGRRLVAPSRAEMQNLIRLLGMDYCSTGLLTAALLRTFSPAFSANDVYGMTFAEDGPDSYREVSRLYYFDEAPIPDDAYESHSLSREREAFASFFKRNTRHV